MDKAIPALLIAAISSLAFMAYKHPKAYAKLWIPFAVCLMTANVGVATWNAGTEFTYRALEEFIVVDKLKEAEIALESLQVPMTWVLPAFVGLYLYLFALTFLPALLGEDKPK